MFLTRLWEPCSNAIMSCDYREPFQRNFQKYLVVYNFHNCDILNKLRSRFDGYCRMGSGN